MKNEYSIGQIAEMEKSRAISDAELLKTGAEYKIDEKTGEKRLVPTKEQIEVIHQSVELLLAKGMSPEEISKGNLEIDFETEESDIGYEFELEQEQRIMVDPKNFEIKEWKNHVVDIYDASGRCRIRIKNGEPRMSLKVPLLSQDTDRSKCCIRLEFKPKKDSQKKDLLSIVELINGEAGTKIHEKWGTPLKLNNGEKVWINKNDQGDYWIETDESEKIEDLLPEGIDYLGHKKSSIKINPEKQVGHEAVIERLMSLSTIKEALESQDFFADLFEANQKKLSRTAKGKIDTSVSEKKEEAKISGKELEKQFKINLRKLLKFIQENKDREFASDKDLKVLTENIILIANDKIAEDPLLLRSWDVKYSRHQSPEGLENEMDNFYNRLFEKINQVKRKELSPTALAFWIEFELNSKIHPFADGCGRSSQALASFFLNYFKAPLPQHESRDDYYKAMNGGSEAFIAYYYQMTEKALIKEYLSY